MKIKRVLVSRVVSCFDGDTFRCDVDTWPKLFGHKIPVRIRGVNCPERSTKDPELALIAVNAHAYTKSALLNARKIELQNVQRGKYFRLVADVLLDDVSMAEALIAAGLGVPYGKKTSLLKGQENEKCNFCYNAGDE